MRNETHSLSLSHVILTVVAIAGLALFILACRPSWSPDSQKVLYSYWDKGSKKAAVVLFDRKTRTSRIVFERSNESGEEEQLAAVQWTKDGQRALVTIHAEDYMQLIALPIDARVSARTYTLGKLDDAIAPLPFPQIGHNVFLSGGRSLVRVNLETGEVLRKELEDKQDCFFYDADDRVLYLRKIKEKSPAATSGEPANTGSAETKHEEEPLELGEIDQTDFTFHLWTKFDEQTAAGKGFGSPSAFLDVNPKNGSIAASADAPKGQKETVLLIGKSGVEKVLDPRIANGTYHLGNVQWSRDGRMIYVSAVIEDPKSDSAEFAVVEVPLDTRGSRIDRLEKRAKKEFTEEFLSYAQIALSPDGKMIAVTRDVFDEHVRPEKKGLFLLDLSKPDRPVNFYPAPPLAALPKGK